MHLRRVLDCIRYRPAVAQWRKNACTAMPGAVRCPNARPPIRYSKSAGGGALRSNVAWAPRADDSSVPNRQGWPRRGEKSLSPSVTRTPIHTLETIRGTMAASPAPPSRPNPRCRQPPRCPAQRASSGYPGAPSRRPPRLDPAGEGRPASDSTRGRRGEGGSAPLQPGSGMRGRVGGGRPRPARAGDSGEERRGSRRRWSSSPRGLLHGRRIRGGGRATVARSREEDGRRRQRRARGWRTGSGARGCEEERHREDVVGSFRKERNRERKKERENRKGEKEKREKKA